MSGLEDIYEHIDKNIDKHIAKLREFLRQPTISNTGEGMEDGAELLKSYFEEIGCQKVEIVPTSGWPVVYGDYQTGAEKTLIIYMMYDCMPADEPTWSVPPFEARLVENHKVGNYPPFKTVVMARGATNSKGPLIAFLNAMESIKAVEGKLPVNIKFVAEGEEEQASKHLPMFVNEHKEELRKADAMFFPLGGQDLEGNVRITPGTKGISYVQLECSGVRWGKGPEQWDIHGSNKVIVDSPVWRFIHALKTMTTDDGNEVLIEGWYDNVAPPLEEELEIIDNLIDKFDFQPMKEALKVDKFILNEKEKKKELLTKYFCEPSGLNIDGIWGGYTGPGSKTVLPYKVSAKLDVRFVPNQTSKEFLPKIRAHLDKHGYQDIVVKPMTSGEWARTSLKSDIWQALKNMYTYFGLEPMIVVRNIGFAPFSLFCHEPLNLPGGFAWGMLGHGDRSHSPNEYFVIEGNDKVFGLAGCEKSFVTTIYNYANSAYAS